MFGSIDKSKGHLRSSALELQAHRCGGFPRGGPGGPGRQLSAHRIIQDTEPAGTPLRRLWPVARAAKTTHLDTMTEPVRPAVSRHTMAVKRSHHVVVAR